MLLAKWQPTRNLSAWPKPFFSDIDNLLARFWDDDLLKAGVLKEAEWMPRVDIEARQADGRWLLRGCGAAKHTVRPVRWCCGGHWELSLRPRAHTVSM